MRRWACSITEKQVMINASYFMKKLAPSFVNPSSHPRGRSEIKTQTRDLLRDTWKFPLPRTGPRHEHKHIKVNRWKQTRWMYLSGSYVRSLPAHRSVGAARWWRALHRYYTGKRKNTCYTTGKQTPALTPVKPEYCGAIKREIQTHSMKKTLPSLHTP